MPRPQTPRWDRAEQVALIRTRIWEYLTPTVAPEQVMLDAGALLELSESDLLALARVYFLQHPVVRELVAELPQLLRRLATTTAFNEERSAERVRGAIKWPATFAAQIATGLPLTYVTAPPERAYQTPENELLVFVLNAIVVLGTQTGWHTPRRRDSTAPTWEAEEDDGPSQVGRLIHSLVDEANRWLSTRALLQVQPRPPTPRSVARVRAGRARRRYQKVLTTYALYDKLIARLSTPALQDLIENAGLTTRRNDKLFELRCTFAVIDALDRHNWRLDKLALFGAPPQQRLELHGTKGNDTLELWYQHAPAQLGTGSRYREVLDAHHFDTVSPLRPDLVLRHRRAGVDRWLIIEAKLRRASVNQGARDALQDLLAYRRAFDVSLDPNPQPYGLGIVWGLDLAPTAESEVMLCTLDRVEAALAMVVG